MEEVENTEPLKGLAWVGEKLKSARVQKKISLYQVSKTTRINVLVLEEIESGELKKSPSAVFIRGFIRTYGELLGVDDEEFIQELNRIPELQEMPTHNSHILNAINTVEKGGPSKKIVILSILVVLGGGYYLFASYWDSIASIFNDVTSEETTAIEVKKPQSKDDELTSKAPLEKKKQATKTSTTNNSEKVSKPSVQQKVEKKPLALPPPVEKEVVLEEIAKLDPLKQKPEEERKELAVEQITVTTIPTTLVIQPKPPDKLALRVLAVSSSWLAIKVDQQSVLEVLLQTGEEYFLEAEEQFLLTVGNTKNVDVFLNGNLQVLDQSTDLLENWLLDKSTLTTQ